VHLSFQILCKERIKRLITGDEAAGNSFGEKVFLSFVGTLIQSLHDLTTDIKEFVRLGRALWPKYSSPIRPVNIDNTLESIRKSKKGNHALTGDPAVTEREILAHLDQKILPFVRYAIDNGLGTFAFDLPATIAKPKSNDVTPAPASASSHDVPFLVKYLLLSAYVCQANRPDKDKQLFSIQKNGRRKRGGGNHGNNTEEEAAFGSTSVADRLRSLRPRTYPAERLYSLYVSMVSLNPSNDLLSHDNNDNDDALKSLGNIHFHETVAYLRSLGILHDFPKRSATDTIRLSQRSFWSSITKDEAYQVAKSVNFPLDRYIL